MNRLEEVMRWIGSRPSLIHAAVAGDQFGDSAPYRVEDGIAIVNVIGPLLNQKCDCGGCTFYGDIQDQLKAADADPTVRGVLLNINSPGGQTDNAFETAAVVAAMSKPCYAVAGTSAYSAAYLIASQADKIYCTPTSGGVGSIGVYCGHMEYSEMLKQIGIKVTLISAGEGKTNGNPYEPLSAEAYAEIKAEIDRLYGEFVGAIEKGREMTAVSIIKMGAKCFEGADAAIAAGLADAPGDLSAAWVDLCTEIQRPKSPAMPSMGSAGKGSVASATENEEVVGMADEKKPAAAEANKPAAADVEKLVADAHAAGFGEAGEIVELCAMTGFPAMAGEFITGRKPIKDVRAALMNARAEADKKALGGKELSTGVVPGADAANANESQGKAKPWGEVMKALGLKKEGK